MQTNNTKTNQPLQGKNSTATDLLKLHPELAKEIERLDLYKKECLKNLIIDCYTLIFAQKNEILSLNKELNSTLRKASYLMQENIKLYKEEFAPMQIIVLHKN